MGGDRFHVPHTVIRNETGRTGVLTDGYEWRLFHLDGEYGLYQATFHAQRKDGQCVVLSNNPLHQIRMLI